MPKATADSGTPRSQATTGQNPAASEIDDSPGMAELAALLDPEANTDEPAPAAKTVDEEESNNALSQPSAEPDGADDEADAEETPSPEDDDVPSDEEPDADPDEEQDDEDPEEPEGLTKEAQHAFNRIVAKEKAKRKSLEEQFEGRERELQAEIDRLQGEVGGLLEQVPGETATTPIPPMLAKVKTADEAATVEANAQKYHRWAQRQLERMRFRPTEVETALRNEGANLEEYTEETMGEWLMRVKDNAQDVIDAAPAVRQRFERKAHYARAEQRMTADAERLIPWLKNPKSPQMALFKQIENDLPEIKRRPNWKALVAAHVEGMMVLKARADRVAQSVSAARTKPKAPLGSVSEPTKAQKATSRRAAAFSRAFEKGGRAEDLAALLQ